MVGPRPLVLFASLMGAASAALAQPMQTIDLDTGEAVRTGASSADEAELVRIAIPELRARLPASERDGLGARIDAAYARMEARMGPQPSIWSATVRGGPIAHYARSEPSRGELGVVFLHGTDGAFVWPCAMIAEAARSLGGSTVCPSMGLEARWTSAEGRARVRSAIAFLRAHGARTVILAGLSTGGAGASRLVGSLRRELSGLVLLSGVARSARTRVPALVIHGSDDTMIPLAGARRFVDRSAGAELVVLDGGHFAIADHIDEVVVRLRGFFEAQLSRRGSPPDVGSLPTSPAPR
ncbi:MAG: alpha/beta fold hydrolase [Sandaracinaceae bacterium]